MKNKQVIKKRYLYAASNEKGILSKITRKLYYPFKGKMINQNWNESFKICSFNNVKIIFLFY